MTPEWEAERALTAPEAAALISRQFPELRRQPVELLATGWDNTVFLVGDDWAFRFPRRAIALPGLLRERDILPQLAEHLPLPIPVPEHVGHPSDDYPWPFWGARLIPGDELTGTDAPPHTAAEAGAFLRTLHQPALATEFEALPRDPLHRGDPLVRAPMARERLANLQRQALWRPDPAAEALLRAAEPLGPSTDPFVVTHGDLHMRHLLVAPDGRPTGVIDWGDLCLADPAVDLSLAYGAFSGTARAAFLSAYGPIDPARELRARTLALFLCATLAEYAASTAHPDLLAAALAGLRRATT